MADQTSDKTFYSLLALLFCIAGIYAVLEPNMQGIHGYHEVNTLGRLVGWAAFNSGLAVLAVNHATVARFRAILLRGIPHWQFFLVGLFIIGFLSGTVGFVTGKSPGIEHLVTIKDPWLRIAEALYLVLSVTGYFYYKRYKEQIISFLNDVFSNDKHA